MDFSNYLFRCHSLGYIMTDPKGESNLVKYEKYNIQYSEKKDMYNLMDEKQQNSSKGQTLLKSMLTAKERKDRYEKVKQNIHLSDTCKTHLCDLYTVAKYERFEDIKSKYMEKGLLCEEDGITLYCLYKQAQGANFVYHKKNKTRLDNDYISGEWDIEDDERITDIKINWSIFQFMRTASKPIKSLYQWQDDGYMWLTGKKLGRTAYCLVNTPEQLLIKEIKSLEYGFIGSAEDLIEATAELRKNHAFDDIPLCERVREFDVEYDESRIERIKTRVTECRKFLQSLEDRNFETINNEEDEN